MKQHSPTISQETKTTVADVVRWVQELDHLHSRIALRFARPEPRRRALAFLHGILSTTSRKNGWQLAEHAREARPDGMQRLLSSAVWDTDGVRDDLRTWLEARGYPYVLAVPCNELVGIMTPDGVRRRVEAAQVETFLLPAQDWQRLSMSEGSKGPRLFDWACVPLLHRWEDDGQHWLLIGRSLTEPHEKAYYARLWAKGDHVA